MKRILIITHIPYWLQDTGDRARLYTLIEFLKRHASIIVAYGGIADKRDFQTVNCDGDGVTTAFIGEGKPQQLHAYVQLFGDFISKNEFDVCIIEHIFLSFLLPLIPKDTKVMLDAHDIVSDRIRSFSRYGYDTISLMNMSEEEEIENFRKFDSVIFLQQNEYNKVCRIIGSERVILAPHPALLNRRPINNVVRSIGYVASNYAPNVNALTWFIKNIWPLLDKCGIELKIFGNIADDFAGENGAGVILRGFEPDMESIYSEIDIVINPVFFGAGLKIKNVEALANGLPLVTTYHGAQGLESGIGVAFFAADEPPLFHDNLVRLINSVNLRRSMGENAYEFAKERFSIEKCFTPLLNAINKNQ